MSSEVDERGERRWFFNGNLILETVRRRTFVDWKSPYVVPDDLAAAMLYCERIQDHTKCVFCKGLLGMWEPGDIPEKEHQKNHVCHVFKYPENYGNVPKNCKDENLSKLHTLILEYHDFLVSHTLPRPPKSIVGTDAVKMLVVKEAVFPHLTTLSSRLKTFSKWPKDIGIEAETMADAGFFSTELADWVQCFFCGGGLYGWLKGDDPSKDHARFYSFCPFIQEKLGEEEVLKVCAANPPPKTKDRSVKLTDEEVDLMLHYPMCKKLVRMGVIANSVKQTMKCHVETHGFPYPSANRMATAVYDWEDLQKKTTADAAISEKAEEGSSKTVPAIPTSPNPVLKDDH